MVQVAQTVEPTVKVAQTNFKNAENDLNLAQSRYETALANELKKTGKDYRIKFDDFTKNKISYQTKKQDKENATPKIEKIPIQEANKNLQNELADVQDKFDKWKIANYENNLAKAQSKPVTLWDKTGGNVTRALQDLVSPLTQGEAYEMKDEKGNKTYLPSYNELRQQKVQSSYGDNLIGKAAKLGGDITYGGTKILGASGIDALTGGIGGKALYWTDMATDNYKNVKNQGYSNKQALANTAIATGTEFLTEKFLGGLAGRLTGGEASAVEDAVSKAVSKVVSNPQAAKLIGSMTSEGLEEFTQEYIGALNDKITLGKDTNLEDLVKDSLYSGLVGAGTAGIVEGGINSINVARPSFNQNNQPIRSQETPIQAPITQNNINAQEQVETTPIRQENEQIIPQQVQTRVEPQTIETKPVETQQNNINATQKLENRVSGDKLLDAQDFINEVKDVGANVDDNGYVTVYHQTTPENAKKILNSGRMSSKEQAVFFSTSQNASQSDGRGSTKLEFKIPAEELELDDIFSDNADVKINLNGKKDIDVSKYLVRNNNIPVETSKLTQQEQQELDTLKDFPFELDEQQERRMDELLLKQNKDLEKNMSPVRDLSDVRDFSEVGSPKINAYQYDNPEVKPYFQEVAKDMLYDLDNSTKGERYMTEDGQFKGIKRNVPNDIAELLDGENGVKYSYKEIEDGLNAIIKDNGAENKAVAKRLEFYIDQRLRNGYMDSIVGKIPANNEYIETLRNKNAGENPNIPAEMEKENLLKVTPETLEPKTQEINNYLKENVPLRQGEAYSRTPQTAVNSMRLYENSPEISDFKRETLTHIVATDKAAKIDASEKYKENGSLENNAAYVRGLLQSDKRLTKNDKALAIYTMNEALKQGNKEIADNIISDLTVLDVEAGQWSQASKLMKQMTPLGQLETFTKMVQRSIDKGNPRFKNVKITQDMIDDVMDSYTDGKFDNDKFATKMENFKQQVQEQMTPTLMDKFNSMRMLGMLGAPRTHLRNVLANVGGIGLRVVKNFNDRVAETVFIRDQSKRTHTFKQATSEIKSFVDEVVKSEKDTISGDKYTNNKLDFQKNMKIFNDKHKGMAKIVNPISKIMNMLSKGNSWALEAEDTLFSSFAYKRSLQEFLTAQGMKTREDIQNNPKILEKGKDYALQQALESTYRQDSQLASAISNYVKKAESPKGTRFDKAAGIVIESNLPFKKTPINIAKTGVEYSPIGLVNGVYDTFANVKNGKIEMSQAIDEISKGITGMGLLGVGVLLAHNGFEIGAADDDEKDKKSTYDKLLGEQEYSIKIGDKYYDLSWMSPSAMPFFTGVELYKTLVKEKEFDGNTVVDVISKTIDPLSSMSFLQGLSYTLKSYADSPGEFFSTLGLSAVENYVSQYLPTFLSQIASFTDSKQRTTSTSGDSSFTEGEKLFNQLKLKIPGKRQTLPTKTDSWGRDLKNENYMNFFNAFVNPSNTKTDLKDKTDKELERLYYSIGADDKLSSSALPKVKFDKYLTFKGEKYNLSNKELSEYKKTYGKIAKQNVDALLQTDEYKSADDRQKAKYLESIYDYSNQKAKEQYGEKHNLDYDDYKVDQLYALVDAFDIPLEVAVTNKNIKDLKAEDGISGTKRKIAAVDDIDELDEIQKDALKRKFTMFMGNSSYKKRYDGTDVSYALNDALDYSDVSSDKINEIKRFLNIGE